MGLASGSHSSETAALEYTNGRHVGDFGLGQDSAHARFIERPLHEGLYQLGRVAMATPFGHDRVTDLDSPVREWRTEVATARDERRRTVRRRPPNGVPNIPSGGRRAPFGEPLVEIRDGVPVIFAWRPAREDNGTDQVGEALGVFELGREVFDRRRHQIQPGRPHATCLDTHDVNLPDRGRRGGVPPGSGACTCRVSTLNITETRLERERAIQTRDDVTNCSQCGLW